MISKPGYLPSLDGWRAVAVLMVILSHDSLYRLGPTTDSWLQEHGAVGVDVFFGISGLLICSRLLEEEREHGRISLRGFYTRRALRILPAAYAYLLTLIVLHLCGLVPLVTKEVLAAIFFYRNYSTLSTLPGHISWYTAHFWSLAVEEHFYLILPGLLVFSPKRWRVPLLSLLVVFVCAWRLYRQQTRPWDFLFEHTDTRLDALLIPAIFVVLLERQRWRAIASRISRWWFIPAALAILLVVEGRFARLTPIVLSVSIPLMLLGTVLHPSAIFARFLELPVLRFVGRISYSLYLWQQLFFTVHDFPSLRPLGALQDLPLRWVALFVVAGVSYYVLEKPCIRLGHRLAPPATPGRPGE